MKLSSKARLSFLVLIILIGSVVVYATTIGPTGVYDTPWGNFTVGVKTPSITLNGVTRTTWWGDINGISINATNINATGAYTFGSLFDANTTFSANYSWVGDAMRVNCGENVSAGELVRFGDVGRARLTDADLDTHVPCVGMVLEDGVYSGGSVGESTLILFRGFVYNSAWNLTQGDPVFVGEALGEMQLTAPSDSGDQVQVIGIAYTDTILYFNPDYTVLEIT